MIPGGNAVALISHLRTVVGLKVTVTHAGTVAVRPKHRLTEEIRQAIESVGIEAIRGALDAERSPVERGAGDTRPELPGKVTDLMQDARRAWEVLRAANEPPTLFRHAGLAWVEPDDDGRSRIVQLDAARLTHYVSQKILFTVERTIGDVVARVPVPPPSVLVRELLATPNAPVPTLARIVTTPVLTRTGALHEQPGYDAVSRAFYAPPPGFIVPTVVERPTVAQIVAARDLLIEAVQDFPFVAPSDLAHTLALILSPFLRELIEGPVPLVLIVKPAPGTGATLLADVVVQIVAGSHVGPLTECEDEAEWRKTLTAALETGPSIVYLDNLTGELRSGQLSSAITRETWEGRRLGATEIVTFPVRCVWLGTGNNVKLNTDMVRRTVRIALDAHVERPWLREEDGRVRFRHPDLLDWCRRERARLVHAALILARAWLAASRPMGAKKLGGFEAWSRVLGGVLNVAGVPGFLANLRELYEEADIEADEARRFLIAWWSRFGDDPRPPADLFTLASSEEVALALGGQTEHARRCSFGRLLERHCGRPYAIDDGLNVTVARAPARHRALWRLLASNGHAQESQVSQESFLSSHARIGNPNSDREPGGEGIGVRETPATPATPAGTWEEL